MTIPGGGGLELVRPRTGTAFLRCPVQPCQFRIDVRDRPDVVELGASEDDIRRHFATHPVEDWLRTIAALQREAAAARDEAERCRRDWRWTLDPQGRSTPPDRG